VHQLRPEAKVVRSSVWSALLGLALVVVSLQSGTPVSAQARDPRFFDETGFRIDDDAFWSYFNQHGGVRTLG
jgi:hypothetical protein